MSNDLPPTLDRNQDGTFAEGHKALNRPYRRHAETVRMLTGKYTPEELVALNEDPKSASLSALEIMALRQIINAMLYVKPESNADVRAERETLLERMEGKPRGAEELIDGGPKLVIQIVQFNGVEYDTRRHALNGQTQQAQGIDVRHAEGEKISDARQIPCGQRQGEGNANGEKREADCIEQSED